MARRDEASEAGEEWLQRAIDYPDEGVRPLTLGDKACCSKLVQQGFLEVKGDRLFITESGKGQIMEPARKPVRAVHGRVQDEEAENWSGWRTRD